MPLNLNPNSKKKERKTEERKNRMGFLILIINATDSCSVIGGMGWDVGCSKRVGAEIRMHERLDPEGMHVCCTGVEPAEYD